MSKAIPASCVANVVTAEGVPVPSAVILSQGVAESEGVLLLDEDEAFYIAQRDSDLKTTLEKLIETLTQTKAGLDKAVKALNSAANALTTLDTAGYIISVSGGSGAPAVGVPATPFATSDISAIGTAAGEITTAGTALEAIKTELETFKEALK